MRNQPKKKKKKKKKKKNPKSQKKKKKKKKKKKDTHRPAAGGRDPPSRVPWPGSCARYCARDWVPRKARTGRRCRVRAWLLKEKRGRKDIEEIGGAKKKKKKKHKN
jgi:hypothetical protein